MPISLDEFAQRLTECSLVARNELDAVLAASSLGGDPAKDAERLARELVRLKKLTPFQAQQIYAGKGKSLLLGNYLLLEKLGQGGMGMVLKAEHRRMKRLVALKILSPAVVKSDEAVKRFQREVEAAAKLIHPNIVTAFDADEANGTHFLVMEFVPGRDLASIVATEGALAIPLAIDCIRQAACGLAFAHQNGIVHRDIKPANLLLDPQGTIKILDMGLARIDSLQPLDAKEGLTQSGQVMGTVDYMAPEQAFDVRHADGRADIYSLGCTLFRLLTNTNLYDGETLVQKLMAHQNQPIPSLRERQPEVSAELEAIFQKMVAKKPAERYQSMSEVEGALNSVGSAVRTNNSYSTVSSVPSASPNTNQSTRPKPNVIFAPPYVDGHAATVSLSAPLESTDPVSELAIQVERNQFSQVVATTKQPLWKQPLALIGCVATLLLLSLGIGLSIGNRGAKPSGDEPEKGSTRWQGWPADAPMPAIAPFSSEQARKHQDEWAEYLKIPREWENSIGMKFVLIPPGEFTMGATDEEIQELLREAEHEGSSSEPLKASVRSLAPQHRVCFTKPVYIGIHEVTQKQYETVLGMNPSGFAKGGKSESGVVGMDTSNFPVEQVSWDDATEFCFKLSKREQLAPFYWRTGEKLTTSLRTGYRLPTDALWEFACRAGTTTKFWNGDSIKDLTKVAWFGNPHGGCTHAVGELQSNPFGLFDTHGNLIEWCEDWWEESYFGSIRENPVINPTGPPAGTQRVFRHGHWAGLPSFCGSSMRDKAGPTFRNICVGFRVALPIEAVREALKATGQASSPRSATFALKFDGIDDYVHLPTLKFAPTDTVTIEARVTPLGFGSSGEYEYVAQLSPARGGQLLQINSAFHAQWSAQSLIPARKTETITFDLSRPKSEIKDRTFDLAVTLPPVELAPELFVNGKKQSGRTGHVAKQFNFDLIDGSTIGGIVDRQGKIHGTIHARIEQVRISRGARFTSDYQPPSQLTKDADTLALYRFDEVTGDVLRDSSGHHHHGKINGAKWVRTDGAPIENARN